jgi:hypothetical protein
MMNANQHRAQHETTSSHVYRSPVHDALLNHYRSNATGTKERGSFTCDARAGAPVVRQLLSRRCSASRRRSTRSSRSLTPPNAPPDFVQCDAWIPCSARAPRPLSPARRLASPVRRLAPCSTRSPPRSSPCADLFLRSGGSCWLLGCLALRGVAQCSVGGLPALLETIFAMHSAKEACKSVLHCASSFHGPTDELKQKGNLHSRREEMQKCIASLLNAY